jgi:pimeloyl-ACP methyl ester carboxylesterase
MVTPARDRGFARGHAADGAMSQVKTVRTKILEIAYEESGPADGPCVILLHGFPDDVRAFDRVVPPLAAAGCRVLVPYLRGYGPTRFLAPATPRSGQQAAIGEDVRDLMDALGVQRAALAGYDWGGRAACIAAALWPERVRALVSIGGYHIQDLAVATKPRSAMHEFQFWYQWYLMTERGRAGLEENRRALCSLMWRLWSPNWSFDDATFERTAASFDNPDFVEVVLHSYRHRNAAAPGYPEYDRTEAALAKLPLVTVPAIILHGADDGVAPAADTSTHGRFFTDLRRRTVVPVAGHFLPEEAPGAVVDALLELGVAGRAGR